MSSFIIYRPFPDCKESASILSEDDAHLIGKLQVSLVIKTFLGKVDLLDYSNEELFASPNIQWYWNNGQPYLKDLVTYYKRALITWCKMGGATIDYLEDLWQIIDSHPCRQNKGPWTEAMSNIHKFAILDRHFFWYQRFFCNETWNIRYRKLIDPSLFVGNLPRELPTDKIMEQTYEIPKPD